MLGLLDSFLESRYSSTRRTLVSALVMKANEPAMCVVECQTRDSTASMCVTVLKYLTTSFYVPQLNYLQTHCTDVVVY